MTAHPRPDLHCHSTYPMARAPAWLAQRAHSRGVDLWALTDHDEVGGVASRGNRPHAGPAFFAGRGNIRHLGEKPSTSWGGH